MSVHIVYSLSLVKCSFPFEDQASIEIIALPASPLSDHPSVEKPFIFVSSGFLKTLILFASFVILLFFPSLFVLTVQADFQTWV